MAFRITITLQSATHCAHVRVQTVARVHNKPTVLHILEGHTMAVKGMWRKGAARARSRATRVGSAGCCVDVYTIRFTHCITATDIAWAVTNDMLVSVSLDCTLRLWQLVTGDAMKVIDTQKKLLSCALCPLNNNFVVVCCRAGHILPCCLFVRFILVNRW
jgi:WD40 repeat protein